MNFKYLIYIYLNSRMLKTWHNAIPFKAHKQDEYMCRFTIVSYLIQLRIINCSNHHYLYKLRKLIVNQTNRSETLKLLKFVLVITAL